MRKISVKNFKITITAIFIALTLALSAYLSYEVGGYKKYAQKVGCFCERYDVKQSLCLAIMRTESGFNEKAKSLKGAVGLMQLMPETAEYMARSEGETINDITSSDENIRYGTAYLNYLSKKFSDENAVICAYNAGETKVREWIKNGKLDEKRVSYPETLAYLKKVKRRKFIYEVIL